MMNFYFYRCPKFKHLLCHSLTKCIMKNLKINLIATLFFLTCQFSFGQTATSVTFVKSINTMDANKLVVDLNGIIETEYWNKDHIRVLVTVKADNATRETIKCLAMNQQFKITTHFDEATGHLSLSMPNMHLPISVNGNNVDPELNFKIFMPNDMRLKILLAEHVAEAIPMMN